MTARIQLPVRARRGEVIEIRLLIQHAMETGYRYDEGGKDRKSTRLNSSH